MSEKRGSSLWLPVKQPVLGGVGYTCRSTSGAFWGRKRGDRAFVLGSSAL